jgi:undecaprenyl-diphosphatase
MIEVAILSVLQGIAEFLPVSSSGHLVLGKSLLGLGDVGMRLDIFLHVGTLLSIFVFYFSVIRRIVSRLEWSYMAKVVLSAIPAAIVGICFKDSIETAFASPKMVGGALVFTGLVLTATRFLPKGEKDVSFLRAVVMGVAQAVAILPGVSRSGMTLAAARASKVDGEKAAEFSFLMSAPPIAGAALLEVLKAMKGAESAAAVETGWGLCVFGALLAGVVGWFALRLLVASLKGRWFWLFGPYCLVAGVLTLVIA